MKKVLCTGLLALCAIALAQQEASAWKNARFGIGLNWDYQSGGNSALWGAWRNGQPPGPEWLNSGAYQPRYQGPMNGFYPQGPQGFGPMPHGPGLDPYGPGFDPHGPGFDSHGAPPPPFGHSYLPPTMQPMMPYAQPYQFATYPRPTYYYYGR